jgi:hypothetical protein
VLVLAELPASQLRHLKNRGALLTHVRDVSEALVALAEREYDAFIVEGVELQTDEQRARERCRLTPFFLVMEGDRQFAILVVPPDHSYLEDGMGISLPDAVMSLDVGKLLLRGPALA